MKRLLLIACLLATPAFAADAPPAKPAEAATTAPVAPFAASVPITITGEEYNALVTYLNQQPAGIATPILNFLVGKQQAAQAPAKKP